MDRNKAQAVCVNAGIKIDPQITITSKQSSVPPIELNPDAGERVSDIVFNGAPVNDTLRLMITVPQGSGVDSERDPNGSSGRIDGLTPVTDNA